ncbi:hypothetical protein FIBSPDRAFT_968414 [Athelia psychrophila]|uniref:Uncharacterized protein n=1 Tax=Athelia psychrophila TaxID=1759441 RepID=A0A167UN89_9AGAM|nr:hypothetical protein FIBSPDRAFT_968414 [Fibularhizoctonia sp. CBS 109695]
MDPHGRRRCTVTADAATSGSGEVAPTHNHFMERTHNSNLEGTRDSTLENTCDSLVLPTTEDFEVAEREVAQSDFESLASTLDAEASTAPLFLLPNAAPSTESTFSPIPPHPAPAVPIFNFTPPIFIEHDLPPIPEDGASIPLPPSVTFPPPRMSGIAIASRLPACPTLPNRNVFPSEITLAGTILAGTRDSLINHADLQRKST